ncbi:uncharacterized protein LOC122379213 [Amphibalanus amphitrite]|uniref:uncharacterized protein LOC122379213 n=1 Tax=Amphibalanus amphitrite TaxID=1232801 RepID=UPI001C904A5E|nr:uncharacterized protein LOC122379213 [Amphibalanus amphitrite]
MTHSCAEFGRLRCSVLVVSFGAREGALRWLADTGCEFPLLLDPERQLYRALGLARSIAKVWQHSTLQYYGGQKAAGRPLPAAYTGVEDDPHQMGGDFIVDGSDRLVLVHCSTSPPDRPTVPALLTAVRALDEQSQ